MPSADEIRDGSASDVGRAVRELGEVGLGHHGSAGARSAQRSSRASTSPKISSISTSPSGTGEPGLSIARLVAEGPRRADRPGSGDAGGRRATSQGARGLANIETKVCSADELPFDDATFDSVSVRFGYMFFPDLAKATAEFARVLRPGGRLCSSVWVKPEENPWTAIAMQAIATEAVVAPPDPDGPSMFRCAAPGLCQCAVRGRGPARHRRVGRRRRTRDPITRAVLGDDERARLARGCRASAGRRTGAGADPGATPSREVERVRAGRHGRGFPAWRGASSGRPQQAVSGRSTALRPAHGWSGSAARPAGTR